MMIESLLVSFNAHYISLCHKQLFTQVADMDSVIGHYRKGCPVKSIVLAKVNHVCRVRFMLPIMFSAQDIDDL